MMGHNHAISGAAAWVAISASTNHFPALGVVHLEPWQVLTGAIVCAGAALLPDADHHNATIAHSVPVVGGAVAGAAGKLSGGHRHGMHSLLAIAVTWFATLWIGKLMWEPDWWFQAIPVGAAVATAALIGFATKATKIVKSWPKAWIIGILSGAALTLFLPDQIGWFPLCVTVGYAVHILGDFLTVEGINWLWPFKLKAPKAVASAPLLGSIWHANGYMALPVLGHAGSMREHIFGIALGLYAVIGIGVSFLPA